MSASKLFTVGGGGSRDEVELTPEQVKQAGRNAPQQGVRGAQVRTSSRPASAVTNQLAADQKKTVGAPATSPTTPSTEAPESILSRAFKGKLTGPVVPAQPDANLDTLRESGDPRVQGVVGEIDDIRQDTQQIRGQRQQAEREIEAVQALGRGERMDVGQIGLDRATEWMPEQLGLSSGKAGTVDYSTVLTDAERSRMSTDAPVTLSGRPITDEPPAPVSVSPDTMTSEDAMAELKKRAATADKLERERLDAMAAEDAALPASLQKGIRTAEEYDRLNPERPPHISREAWEKNKAKVAERRKRAADRQVLADRARTNKTSIEHESRLAKAAAELRGREQTEQERALEAERREASEARHIRQVDAIKEDIDDVSRRIQNIESSDSPDTNKVKELEAEIKALRNRRDSLMQNRKFDQLEEPLRSMFKAKAADPSEIIPQNYRWIWEMFTPTP